MCYLLVCRRIEYCITNVRIPPQAAWRCPVSIEHAIVECSGRCCTQARRTSTMVAFSFVHTGLPISVMILPAKVRGKGPFCTRRHASSLPEPLHLSLTLHYARRGSVQGSSDTLEPRCPQGLYGCRAARTNDFKGSQDNLLFACRLKIIFIFSFTESCSILWMRRGAAGRQVT
jgi:hypothetical protein